MEQAENPFINTMIRRLTAVETDVTVLKSNKRSHENQIDTLAIHVSDNSVKIEGLQQQVNELRTEMRTGFSKVEHGMGEMRRDIKKILKHLAIAA